MSVLVHRLKTLLAWFENKDAEATRGRCSTCSECLSLFPKALSFLSVFYFTAVLVALEHGSSVESLPRARSLQLHPFLQSWRYVPSPTSTPPIGLRRIAKWSASVVFSSAGLYVPRWCVPGSISPVESASLITVGGMKIKINCILQRDVRPCTP